MKKNLFLLAVLSLLVACSSPVKLNEVPVEDKAGTQVAAPAAAPAPAPPPVRSAVASVDARPLAAVPSGPAGVAQVIYFDYDSFAIKPEFQAVIEKHAVYIKQDSKRRVAVEGQTAGLRSPTNDGATHACNPFGVALHGFFFHAPCGLV